MPQPDLHIVLTLALLLLAELSVVSTHTTWGSPWWRKSLLWSDRWHLLSLLRWPLSLWVLWQVAPLWPWQTRSALWWVVAGIGGEIVWMGVKRAAGKAWPMWWMQAWRWLKK